MKSLGSNVATFDAVHQLRLQCSVVSFPNVRRKSKNTEEKIHKNKTEIVQNFSLVTLLRNRFFEKYFVQILITVSCKRKCLKRFLNNKNIIFFKKGILFIKKI